MKTFTDEQFESIEKILTKLVEEGINDPEDLDKAVKQIEMVALNA